MLAPAAVAGLPRLPGEQHVLHEGERLSVQGLQQILPCLWSHSIPPLDARCRNSVSQWLARHAAAGSGHGAPQLADRQRRGVQQRREFAFHHVRRRQAGATIGDQDFLRRLGVGRPPGHGQGGSDGAVGV